MDASTRFDTQRVGALPLIVHFFGLLKLGATIDEVVPWEGEVPLGTLAEIMIANRLLQPQALFRIGKWAQQAGLTDCYGLTAEQLNDDRLGRALERLAAHASTIQAALVLKMIKVFKLNVSHIHYDISNVELYGAYEAAAADPPPTPLPTYGRTKSGRKNVKQIQFGINVTNDDAVPIGHLPLDGNTAEAKTHLENLKQLEQLLPKGTLLLYTADTKLDTPENLLGIAAGKGQFLCGGAFLPHLQQPYLKLRERLKPIDYCPKSQAHLPAEQRDAYQACLSKLNKMSLAAPNSKRCSSWSYTGHVVGAASG